MRRKVIFLFLLLLGFSLSTFGQNRTFKVNSVELLESDDDAVKSPRYDRNNTPCALIKVFMEELPGIDFSSGYIIGKSDIKYNGREGYYSMYVAQGIRSIDLKHNDFNPITVKFRDDYGLDIAGGKTYCIRMASVKQSHTVVFNILPSSAKGTLTLHNAGMQESNNFQNGVLRKELVPGEYTFNVRTSPEYYKEDTGSFVVEDNAVDSLKQIYISLTPRVVKVDFKCYVPDAVLYVDGSQRGGHGMKEIEMGEHKIRVRAVNYKDYYVEKLLLDKDQELLVSLEPADYIPVIIFTKNIKDPKLCIDGKEIPNWKNDKTPVKIKRGKHIIQMFSGSAGFSRPLERKIKIDVPNMEIQMN